jgi:lysophospholipase L1-like esterase
MLTRRLAGLLLYAAAALAPTTLRAQNAAAADPPQQFALPETDAGLSGIGPIRQEDWFRDLWLKRRTTFAERAEGDRESVVFFGDSITQGWGDDFDWFVGLKGVNRGISGDTSRGLLLRLRDDVLALDPVGIVLLVGTNDTELGVAPEDIAGNVKLLLEQIADHNAKIPVILCEVMPASAEKKRPADKIKALNAALRAVAKGNERVTVLDTYTLFANREGDAKPEEFPDLLHPNEAGYEKWRAALWPLLSTLGLVYDHDANFQIEPGFTSLFNGKDLTGWGLRPTTDQDRKDIANWSKNDPNMPPWPIVTEPVSFDGLTASPDRRFIAIEDKLVVATPTEGRRIQQIYTQQDFPKDFTLKLEFRATPNADSGVYLRGRQLQCRDYPLAGPYKNLTKYKPQDWNEMVVVVKGRTAHCTVNGEVIEAAYELPETGPIGFEGDRGQMEYRRIRLKQE